MNNNETVQFESTNPNEVYYIGIPILIVSVIGIAIIWIMSYRKAAAKIKRLFKRNK
jgi:heme/copper-type cytochrome/quinol oxidase subunit 2